MRPAVTARRRPSRTDAGLVGAVWARGRRRDARGCQAVPVSWLDDDTIPRPRHPRPAPPARSPPPPPPPGTAVPARVLLHAPAGRPGAHPAAPGVDRRLPPRLPARQPGPDSLDHRQRRRPRAVHGSLVSLAHLSQPPHHP